MTEKNEKPSPFAELIMLHQFTTDELRFAVDGARAGIWSWEVKSGEIRWSLRVGEIYDLQPADYPGTVEAFSALLASPDDDLCVQVFKALDQETGRFEFEHQIVRRDGSVGWVRNSGRMEFDQYYQPKKLLATAVDITAQKEIEHSLQIREEQFLRFSQMTSDYVYETDMTALPLVPSIVAGSFERTVGYTKSELADAGGWTSIMNPEDLKVGQVVWDQLKAGVPTVHEYRIVNRDGETRWLRDHCQPILKDGELVRLVGGVSDFTETKALQEELLRAQKHKAVAQLANAVAHDFNNLLFVVRTSAELMAMVGVDVEEKELTADILLACDRATELTRSLMTFNGNDLPVTSIVRLSEIVRGTQGLLQRAVGEQIVVSLECSPDISDKVEIDSSHLQLVLLNLATNARTAMRDRGQLNIRVASVDPHRMELPEANLEECVLLEIADSGCGIDKENLDRVFDPFFTTATDGKGFGIGLASCRQIIELAGGAIRVRSREGKGTVFSIYLPTVDKPISQIRSGASQYTIGGKERVLVVEDNPAVRRLSVQALTTHGYEVSSVDCIKAAHEAVANQAFDIVVVDMQLPDGHGCDLINELRDSIPGLTALLVSGYVDDELRTKVRADGYNILPKPYSVTALARSVRTTLQTYSH